MVNRYQGHSDSSLEEQQKQINEIERRLDEYREEVARAAVSFKQEMDNATHTVDYTRVLDQQVKSAKASKRIWQVSAILLLVLILLLTVGILSGIQQDGIDSASLGMDFVILCVPILIAIITLRQMNKASRYERELSERILKLAVGEQDMSSDRW